MRPYMHLQPEFILRVIINNKIFFPKWELLYIFALFFRKLNIQKQIVLGNDSTTFIIKDTSAKNKFKIRMLENLCKATEQKYIDKFYEYLIRL